MNDFVRPSQFWLQHLSLRIIIISGGEADYGAGPYTVTFPAGQTVASVDVPITDDSIVEEDETIDLTIQLSSLPNGISVSLPDPPQANITIVDTTSK